MIILPPLQPILEHLDKGFMRSAHDYLGEKVGVSGNTIRNSLSGKNKPSKSTLEKSNLFIQGVIPSLRESKFAIRKFYRMGEWRAFLSGLRVSGTIEDEIQETQALIERLGKLDEVVLKDYCHIDRVIGHLAEFQPAFIEPDVVVQLRDGMSLKELQHLLWMSSAKSVLLIIACYDAEMLKSSGQSQSDSFFLYLMGNDPRKAWVNICKKKLDVSTNEDLGRRYAEIVNESTEPKLPMDEESGIRHIKRIQEGKHRVGMDTLKILTRGIKLKRPLINEDEKKQREIEKAILGISLFISEVTRFLNAWIKEANMHGVGGGYVPDDMSGTYRGFLDYWCNQFGVNNEVGNEKSGD